MFENIGRTLKSIAKCEALCGIIVVMTHGINMIVDNENDSIEAIVFIIVGSILAYVVACFIYGFGQLVQNSDKIVEGMGFSNVELEKESARPQKVNSNADLPHYNQMLEELNNKYENNQISQQEYDNLRKDILNKIK